MSDAKGYEECWDLATEATARPVEVNGLEAAVSRLAPRALSTPDLPSVRAEISAARQEMQNGIDRIIDQVEALLRDQDACATPALTMARCTAILEACAFQDLTGQRLSKVSTLIDDLEPRLADLADQSRLEEAVAPETAESHRRREMMLNGPALRGPEVTQAVIDDLFG